MINITYKGENIKLKDLNLFIISDITFSLIVFLWYLLYKFNIITIYSPLFALIITFIQNLIILILLIYKTNFTIKNAIKYILLLFILKILPILSFYPNNFIIKIKDIFIILYLYFIYIVFIISLIEIFHLKYNIKNIIVSDIKGDNYKNTYQDKIFDLTYDSLIDAIFTINKK